MFKSCAALRPYIAHIDDIYKDFTSYKFRVPVTGAIILDESYERVSFKKAFLFEFNLLVLHCAPRPESM